MRRSLLAIALVCTAPTAHASATFPAVVERVTEAKVTCATCHRDVDAGSDLTPFGAALKARGAVGKDDASLEAALAKTKADGVDSDGDGARDLDELAWGGDPNVADLPPEVPEEPHYGLCSTRVDRGPGRRNTPTLLVFSALALVGIRRRSR